VNAVGDVSAEADNPVGYISVEEPKGKPSDNDSIAELASVVTATVPEAKEAAGECTSVRPDGATKAQPTE
jgi:hypothetical protein